MLHKCHKKVSGYMHVFNELIWSYTPIPVIYYFDSEWFSK